MRHWHEAAWQEGSCPPCKQYHLQLHIDRVKALLISPVEMQATCMHSPCTSADYAYLLRST